MNNYTKPSGKPQKIKVESHLIYVLWNCGIAYADTEAPFIVRTALVGEGAEVKAKLKNDSGKTLEKISGKMTANWFHGWMPIPQNVKMDDMLYIEVELPKHGLNGESNQIPAGPVIQPRSMKWSQKEAKRGDLVKMMAEFIDLPDPTSAVVRVYEYDQSGNHLPVVSIPTLINANKLEIQWEFQYHDDTGLIPTQDELQPYNKKYQQPQYYFVVEIEGALIGVKQESGLMKFKDQIKLEVTDATGAAITDQNFSIAYPDTQKKNGKLTNGTDPTIIQDVPPGPFDIVFEGFGPPQPDSPYEPSGQDEPEE
jgi:hypothetical protein